MTKVEWNPQAAWHRGVEELLAPLSFRGARLPVVATLVWNVVWALVYIVALGGLAFWNFQPENTDYRARSVEQARSLARDVWNKVEVRSTHAEPSSDVAVPTGDPQVALSKLLASPVVNVAFFLRPDGQVVFGRRALHRPGWPARPKLFEQLDPRQLTLADVGDVKVEIPSQPQAERQFDHARDLLLLERLAQQGLLRSDLSPQAHFGSLDLPGELMFFEFKGSRQTGYLGYEVMRWQLESSLIGAVLKEDGLTDLMGVVQDEEAPTVLAGRGSNMLVAKDLSRLDRALDRKVIPGLLLLACVAILRLLAASRDLQALWAERAIALAQSNFLSAVSHELRTPLTTIRMYAEMLEQDVVTDPARRSHYLRTIVTEGERMSRLVENVLDHARAGSQHKTYHLEAVALRDLLEEAVAAVAGPLEAAGMVVELHAPLALTAKLDRDAVVQAVVNLVGNAVKYAAAGGRVVVSALPEGDRIVLTVEDFGPGISPDEQGRVFEPFYRSGSELTRVAPGTGLGLALVAETARAHRGKVELESELGRGSAFKLLLPREPAS